MDINSSLLTIATALIGILCGAAVSSYFSLKSARKDLIFKRKLEYFEKLSKDIEENLRLHKNIIMSLSESSKIKDVEDNLAKLKQKRKSFLINSCPLYFKTDRMTERIMAFVNAEKEIFGIIEALKNGGKTIKAQTIFDLRAALQKLNKALDDSFLEMRLELYGK